MKWFRENSLGFLVLDDGFLGLSLGFKVHKNGCFVFRAHGLKVQGLRRIIFRFRFRIYN